MSASVNRVIIAGNLTRDPQIKFLANEKAVANFGIAINNKYKKADGTLVEEATFVDCECWGRTAELVGQYLVRGSSCLIEGRLKLDVWEKDGQKHSKLRVVADSVQFLDSKRDAAPGDFAREGDAVDQSIARAQRLAARQSKADTSVSAPPPAAGDDEPPF